MRTLSTRLTLVALILGLSLLPMGCGWFGGGTPTTTAAHLGNPATTTTAAASASASGTTEAQQYQAGMTKWANTYLTNVDTGALTFKKPLAPTAKEIKRAKAFATSMHTALDALRNVVAPAEVATAHAQYYAALDAELRALDRLVRAIESKNKRDIELAARDANSARAYELQAQAILVPYLDAAGDTTPSTGAATPTTSSPTG
jgi:hypothetical protein